MKITRQTQIIAHAGIGLLMVLAYAFLPLTKEQHEALATVQVILQGALGAIAQNSNPDGTPASAPYKPDEK
jgi:hypothetical protein